MMDSQTSPTGQADQTVTVLTGDVVDQWFNRAAQLREAEERLNAADLAVETSGSASSAVLVLDYGRHVLRAAVFADEGAVVPPVLKNDAQTSVAAYLSAMAAGIKAASTGPTYGSPGLAGSSHIDEYGNGAAPIAVAAGLLAGAAALADASERSTDAEHHIWAPEAAAAAAGAATAADSAADGADLALTVRSAARAARRIHHGPTQVYLILTALADVVAPQTVSELLVDHQLSGEGMAGFRIAFSMDSSRWATPQSLAAALKANCSAFECVEESGVCDVDLVTETPGPVIERIISIGTPYHLEIEHLDSTEG